MKDLFSWCLEQHRDVLDDLLAYLVACTVDAVRCISACKYMTVELAVEPLAMVQGKPVRAWARVPVSFDLREQ